MRRGLLYTTKELQINQNLLFRRDNGDMADKTIKPESTFEIQSKQGNFTSVKIHMHQFNTYSIFHLQITNEYIFL